MIRIFLADGWTGRAVIEGTLRGPRGPKNVKRSFGESGTLILNYHASSLQLPPVVATLYAHWMHIICTEVLGIQNSEKSRLDPVDF